MISKKLLVCGCCFALVFAAACGKKAKPRSNQGASMNNGTEEEQQIKVVKEKKVKLKNGEVLTFKKVGGPDMEAKLFTEELSGMLHTIESIPPDKDMSTEERLLNRRLTLKMDNGKSVLLVGRLTSELRKQDGKRAVVKATKFRRNATILEKEYQIYNVKEIVSVN